jgi:SAM-dependent methyltransferase
MSTPESQYSTDANLAARQRLWDTSARRPPFSLQSWVIGLARLNGTETVLDVGCGNGTYLELVKAVGLDSSGGMLQATRRRTVSPLVRAVAGRLPFDDRAFDVVLCAHMLYHVDDRQRAVAELRRVLDREGICIVVTNGEGTQPELRSIVEDVVGHGWRWSRPSDTEFSLENGAAQLQRAFETVTRVDCPSTALEVTDALTLADYLASVGDHYRSEVASWMNWDEVVERCRSRAAQIIHQEGAFRITASVGAFICQ